MDPNQKRPRSREKNVTSGGNGAHRRGEGLGTGSVGGQGGYSDRQQSSGGGVKRAAVGGGGGLAIIAIIAMMLFKGGGLGGLLGGGGSTTAPSGGGNSSGGYSASSESKADTSVAAGSRAKRTQILGNGQDKITFMVYMCGTDLESKYKMASSDIEEMKAATLGNNIDIIIYTGGCNSWQSNNISSKVNQIYQIKDGKLVTLVKDDGSKSMTDPKTLSAFIKYCTKNFPANRNELILWDHGGGSVSGYGYDEKYKSSGSMSLAGVNSALKEAGVTFDFIGFDACLMATAETALMLDPYADYLIASEETEPGIGWYYTEWLNKLGKNTSMPTVELGKNIVDEFVTRCGQKCRGQQTTLSVIDLAEFSNTVPDKLGAFANSVSTKMSNKEYKEVSDARYSTREFAASSKIDQVDLYNLAQNMNTAEGKALCEALQSAVKYNRTSSNMSNAYGVSIYFPYQRTSYVDSACSTYSQIGFHSDYSKCIKQFAKLETSGQIAAGGSSSPVTSLFGGGASSGSSGNADIIGELLGAFLGGSSGRSIEGLDSSNTSFMSESSVSDSDTAEYLAQNFFDTSNLVWEESDGKYTMTLPSSQWDLIHQIDLNMFYDDGEGFIDLGLDNVYEIDGDTLIADTDRNWLSIDGNVVAYYHTDTIELGDDKYSINGYVPALLNGERVKLMIVFDNENPNGFIAGAVPDYVSGETDTVAKSMTELNDGDKIDFLCDFYDYDYQYQDSYYIGDTVTYHDNMTISNTDVGSGEVRLMYRITDIYDQVYWTEAISR